MTPEEICRRYDLIAPTAKYWVFFHERLTLLVNDAVDAIEIGTSR